MRDSLTRGKCSQSITAKKQSLTEHKSRLIVLDQYSRMPVFCYPLKIDTHVSHAQTRIHYTGERSKWASGLLLWHWRQLHCTCCPLPWTSPREREKKQNFFWYTGSIEKNDNMEGGQERGRNEGGQGLWGRPRGMTWAGCHKKFPTSEGVQKQKKMGLSSFPQFFASSCEMKCGGGWGEITL